MQSRVGRLAALRPLALGVGYAGGRENEKLQDLSFHPG
jgi:hypothetical protein